ncbi:DUF1206 domain-containing protein [Rhodocytophaga aerolata]|uniref:DUF1206 domain-containing protein n=1 Tax=Rhodocytophaga aerolata TaxID=455078 RepID=A0ABT8RC16_9BACT|nr:DUF1206 domain-containing protein [Rhodocytophaga aerolata]MDO1449610.1 DUF1206 domain-containing protein [Rhodocytophaga aerolata]
MSFIETKKLQEGSQKAIETLARWSYVVKGILFCGVAILAVLSAIGLSSQDANRKEILKTLFNQPLGQILLGLITIALGAHTIWRMFEVFSDPYGKGTNLSGLLHRFTYLLSGISYASLALTALKLLLGNGSGPENEKQIWIAAILQREGGEWLVIIAGVIMVTWASVQGKKAIKNGLYKSLKTDHLSRFWKIIIRLSGAIGFTTLATLLTAIGVYTLKAAFTRNPSWVKSMDDLFKLILQLPYGLMLLYCLAGGLFIFGLFMFVMARYFPFKLHE